jgi:hypothetical protein
MMYQTRLKTAQLGDTGTKVDPILAAANLELTDQDLDKIERSTR